MIASTATVLIWVIALFLVLGELGIDLAPLIAGAGIAGVALGFGAQNVVKDCLAGLFMLIEDQYGIGDVVDLGEAAGTVERITLRTTVLRGLDGTVWHVPNGEVVRVGNQSQLWSVAVVDVAVAYDADIAVASGIFERTARRRRRAVGLRRRRAGGAAAARRRVGLRRRRAPADDHQDRHPGPSSACSGRCASRSSRLRRRRHPRPAAAIRLAARHRLTSCPAAHGRPIPCR